MGLFEASWVHLGKLFLPNNDRWSRAVQEWLYGTAADSRGEVAVFLLLLAVTVAWIRLAAAESAARRLLSLALAAVIGHTLATWFAPYLYLPDRYLRYPVPALAAVMTAAAASGLFALLPAGWARGRTWLRGALAVAYCVLVVFAFGTTGATGIGIEARVRYPDLHRAVSRLPPDSVIAGWPKGPVNNVPYLARRSAFLTHETHQVFHRAYVDEMRRRLRALLSAYFATSPGPLLRLRDEYGVTHLLLELHYFRNVYPRYFKPFRSWVRREKDRTRGGPYQALQYLDGAAVYRKGSVALLALDRLPQ
jgi:hypothetical protein